MSILSENLNVVNDDEFLIDEELQKSFDESLTIPIALLKDLRISAGAKITYEILMSYAKMDHNGKMAFPSRYTLMADIGVSESTIDRYLSELKKNNLLDWTHSPNKNKKHWHNIYILKAYKTEKVFQNGTPSRQIWQVVTDDNTLIKMGDSTPPSSLLTTGGLAPHKKKKEQKKNSSERLNFEKLADQEFKDWRTHYRLDDDLLLGTSFQFDDFLYKLYEEEERPMVFFHKKPWLEKLKILRQFYSELVSSKNLAPLRSVPPGEIDA